MTHSQITTKFLSSASVSTVAAIGDNIAKTYDISREDALAEITDVEAESLLDYIVGPLRFEVFGLMLDAGLNPTQR